MSIMSKTAEISKRIGNIGCLNLSTNFIQILDIRKPNFEKSYGRTFPVKYLGNGLSYNDETRAAGAHR